MEMDALVQQAVLSATAVCEGVHKGLGSLEQFDGLLHKLQTELSAAATDAENILSDAQKEIEARKVDLEKQVGQVHAQLDELDKSAQDLHRRSAEELQRVSEGHQQFRCDAADARNEVCQHAKSYQTEVDTVLARVNAMRSELQGVSKGAIQVATEMTSTFTAHQQLVNDKVQLLASGTDDFTNNFTKMHGAFQDTVGSVHKTVESTKSGFHDHSVEQISVAKQGVSQVLGESGSIGEIRKHAEQLFGMLDKVGKTVREARTFSDEKMASPIRRIHEGITALQPTISVLKLLGELGLL